MSKFRIAWVNPGMGGVRGRADYPCTATGVVDDGENVLALAGQRDRLDEIHCQDRLRLRAQEVAPGNGCPARRRIDAGSLEDLPHRRGGDRDTEEREFTVDTPIPPRRVLGRQPQDEQADRSHRAWTSGRPIHARTGMATLRQVAMPPQHRVRADQQPEAA
ncbi:hypothetical protein [Lentzea sp. NEAU-D7]|uniref:hypothetical protein n=1 Tax=Lentzea sp. NEAU-D7 TaxID=2994667 RepID=UPI00224AB527|nr:hypothetical protein [Lentzea sp. NEAU-D7]MCX2950166.1 hypothetical protein [Lentzea sp. NEAU-D7]